MNITEENINKRLEEIRKEYDTVIKAIEEHQKQLNQLIMNKSSLEGSFNELQSLIVKANKEDVNKEDK